MISAALVEGGIVVQREDLRHITGSRRGMASYLGSPSILQHVLNGWYSVGTLLAMTVLLRLHMSFVDQPWVCSCRASTQMSVRLALV